VSRGVFKVSHSGWRSSCTVFQDAFPHPHDGRFSIVLWKQALFLLLERGRCSREIEAIFDHKSLQTWTLIYA
jgi:hypothetical protein